MSYTPTDNYFQFYVFELLSPYSVQRKDRNDSDRSVVFSGLQGGTKYTVRVMAVSGDQSSPQRFILIRTGKLKLPILKKKNQFINEILYTWLFWIGLAIVVIKGR